MRTKYNRKTRQPILVIGPSIAYVPLTQGQFSRIDSHRIEELNHWNWHAVWSESSGSFYAQRSTEHGAKRISMQAQILDIRGSVITGDHIDRDTLNNQDHNLRKADRSLQAFNQRVRCTNNSGFVGVYWVEGRTTWRAFIEVKGRRMNLGDFPSKELAIIARKQAEFDYAGEYFPESKLVQTSGNPPDNKSALISSLGVIGIPDSCI